jgi:hypothetical protein
MSLMICRQIPESGNPSRDREAVLAQRSLVFDDKAGGASEHRLEHQFNRVAVDGDRKHPCAFFAEHEISGRSLHCRRVGVALDRIGPPVSRSHPLAAHAHIGDPATHLIGVFHYTLVPSAASPPE